MRWILLCAGLAYAVHISPKAYGQFPGGTHALALYGEPPLPGWVPGQAFWPALGPASSVKTQAGVGFSYHPNLPGLGRIHSAIAYQTPRDWLTLGFQKNGWWAFTTYASRLGLSRRFGPNRIGLTMGFEWNQRAQTKQWGYGLGTEHRLNHRLHSGFRIHHQGMMPQPNPSKSSLWQAGFHLSLEQNALSNSLRLHFQEGRRPCSEWVLGYQPSLAWQFWLVGDPIQGLLALGLGYKTEKYGLSLSPLQSRLPGTFLRSTVSFP